MISPQQKTIILSELLENQVLISSLAEKYNIHPNDIYSWKKRLFEQASEIFTHKPKNDSTHQDEKNRQLEKKLKER